MKELTHDEMKSAGWMLIGIAVIASFFGYVWPLFFLVPWGLFMFWEGHKAKKKYLEGLGLKDSSKPIKPPVPQGSFTGVKKPQEPYLPAYKKPVETFTQPDDMEDDDDFDDDFSIFPEILTVRFRYVDGGGRESVRTVDVDEHKGDEYIKGTCHKWNEERTFKVGRIQGNITDVDSGASMTLAAFAARLRGEPWKSVAAPDKKNVSRRASPQTRLFQLRNMLFRFSC